MSRDLDYYGEDLFAVAPAVRANGLVKRYGSITAVDGVTFEVPSGGCYGFLGPNGAGKTTTIKMITCVSPPSSGTLEVLDLDVGRNQREIKGRVGVVPQGMTLDTEIKVRENLVVHGIYHGIGKREAERRGDEMLEFAHLTGRADARVQELSGGMQRRLLIARALMNDPELLVLDEPTTGLDPQARHLVWERLRSLKRQGKTLLLTTHYMEEAARLCDRILVIDNGKVVAEDSPTGLIERHVPPRVLEVHHVEGLEDKIHRAIADCVSEVENIGDRIIAFGQNGETMISRLKEAGMEHHPMLLRDATLEDVFLRLTGHGLTD
ncbi:MAG: ABC transporter ATP-binding protein [Actinobacteria bacterium]|nr:ABC transporter ATP-binding protein [Actinomycetota bacterium]